jgi:hypothetical protein
MKRWTNGLPGATTRLGAMMARRPFRRIAVYAQHGSSTKFIDVSLKHFAADDIRKLMRVIHEQRPDLVLPKNWV